VYASEGIGNVGSRGFAIYKRCQECGIRIVEAGSILRKSWNMAYQNIWPECNY
jgi:hypothetical protein